MPRPYPAEFRARAVALVRAGREQKQIAVDLGIHPVTLSKWVKQDRIDRGEIFGTPSSESVELLAKLAAERVLDQGDIAVLGGLRQAFKSLRRHIRANETIPWSPTDPRNTWRSSRSPPRCPPC